MSYVKQTMQPAIIDQSQALEPVTSVDKAVMDQTPTQDNLAVLKQLSDEGLIPQAIVTEAVMIYLTVDPKAMKDLLVKHLVDAGRRVVEGQVYGEDFYLLPKIGCYTSLVGVQRELGKNGLPPPSWSFRLMTEEERHSADLTDVEEKGVVATATWPSMNNLQVTGAAVVKLSDMYQNMMNWVDGRPSGMKPRNQWRKVDPPRGRTYDWVCEKRAMRVVEQRMRGFKIATPAEKLQAGRDLGLPVLGTEFDGVVNPAAAQASINMAAVDAATKRIEGQVLAILGPEAHDKLVRERLAINQKAMYGDDPFADERPPAPKVIDVTPAKAATAPTVAAEPEPDPFASLAQDDEDAAEVAVEMAADLDIIIALHDDQDQMVAKKESMRGPATEKQIALWTKRCTQAVEAAPHANGTPGVTLVTARLCGVLPVTASHPEFRPTEAQVRSWLKAWLVPSGEYELTDVGRQQIPIVHGEAYKAWQAGAEAH